MEAMTLILAMMKLERNLTNRKIGNTLHYVKLCVCKQPLCHYQQSVSQKGSSHQK